MPGEKTVSREARRDTLAASKGSDFQHGRFEPGARLGERYRIVALLGTGGMGEVYRADDLELGQSVALKFLPERVAADPSWLRRFRNEVRTARQVAHPNVCRIYDIGEEDGHVFLSMEYIDGEDLAGVLRRLGRPSREKAIEISRQICLGLAAAHENGVLHRDLKPANIMIDGRGSARITDFGLAGFLDDLEQAEARAGTPAYMAPEQLTHGKVSVRSDIYTLGLILYELFTGKCVFETNDIEELKRKHTSGSVSTPSSITEEIDPAVERVIMRCLEEQPEQRPQSVYQVLAALPGGDPLAAALAAGETPSPELVANARDAGGLRPPIAVGLLIVMLAFLAVTCFVYAGTIVMPDRSPAVLSVVAQQVLEELGYVDLPRNSVSGYDVNTHLKESLRSQPRPHSELAELDWPPRFRYWRRWTQGAFIPTSFHAPEDFDFDGPTSDSDDGAVVALDSTGRLLGLVVAPSLSGDSSERIGNVDWSPIFRRAKLNESDATRIPPLGSPPVYCDEVAAWRMEGSAETGGPVTFQIGAIGGRPNYFEILGLDEAMTSPTHRRDTYTTVNAFIFVAMIFIIILAWRNLRASRGDRRNAFRCALIMAVLYALLEVLSIRFGESSGLVQVGDLFSGRAGGHIVLHALTVWVIYMAIEPYVRRVWPRMLVGLVRLLSGRLRDPAAGREVLIGVVTACGLTAILVTTAYTEWRFSADDSGQLPSWMVLQPMLSPVRYMSNKVHIAAGTVLAAAVVAGWLVLVRLLTRHSLAAIVLGIVGAGSMCYVFLASIGGRSIWLTLLYSISFGVAIVLLYTRVGLLAGIVAFFLLRPGGIFTGDFNAWFTPYGITEMAILLGLGAYGFWVSLAGQPIFKDMLAEPQPAR
ncbi:MAG: serine/threonine-protein kinase [Planctomycetota bacterium]